MVDPMKKEVRRWWGRARKDLETAKANINIEQFYASAFFSHQATEKALKALYLSKKGKFGRFTIW